MQLNLVSLLPCQTRPYRCSSSINKSRVSFSSYSSCTLYLLFSFVRRIDSIFFPPPCLASSPLLFVPPVHTPISPPGSKCKASSWYQVCHFHLILSIRYPLVSYTVCVNHSLEKVHMRNHRRNYFHSISVCTSGSLSHITTLSTIVDVQLKLIILTPNSRPTEWAPLITFDFRMYK